jgi:hypothetical protein
MRARGDRISCGGAAGESDSDYSPKVDFLAKSDSTCSPTSPSPSRFARVGGMIRCLFGMFSATIVSVRPRSDLDDRPSPGIKRGRLVGASINSKNPRSIRFEITIAYALARGTRDNYICFVAERTRN